MLVAGLVILLVGALCSLLLALRTVMAMQRLIVRYWCGDGPEGSGRIDDINADVARLPKREREVLAAALGESFPIDDIALAKARPFHRHPFKGRPSQLAGRSVDWDHDPDEDFAPLDLVADKQEYDTW